VSKTASPPPLGAHCLNGGVRFAVLAEHAERLVLCLFDEQDRLTNQLDLPEQTDGVWHGFVPGCVAGQRYGYRAYGPYKPDKGHRFDATKLLIDPYARELRGRFRWSDELISCPASAAARADDVRYDSARYVPKGVVTPAQSARASDVAIPWSQTIIYETHVRSFTMRHPEVPAADCGRFAGMRHGQVLEYLKALGVTSIELMPIHFFVDESFLAEKHLRNHWGYNTLSFFAPMNRYAGAQPLAELIEMIDAIHDAGMEVILDVVYNHTAEGNEQGPTLSLRGLNNAGYYRLAPGNLAHYINDSGCGNTLDINSPATFNLVLDSLRYFAGDLGVDGFRFDLAPVLGRFHDGYSPDHPFFKAVADDPILKHKKMIAEPWDVGPGGYQLGHFPAPWAQWNDQFRDTVRRFWRGDRHVAAQFARRLHGSADIFEPAGRGPDAGINLISAHDGFNLRDVVTYEQKHNEANGEDNRDGHNSNYSRNYGVEGDSDDRTIELVRRRQRLNMLATLLWSQGVPMLLAGDEFGHTQRGNNNAYAQDNETTWLDWSLIDDDPDFLTQVQQLVALRHRIPLLRRKGFMHGVSKTPKGRPNIEWFNPDGSKLTDGDWLHAHTMTLALRHTKKEPAAVPGVALLINAGNREAAFALPDMDSGGTWSERFYSGATTARQRPHKSATVGALACALWAYEAG
jgi:glycogen operon protein